MESAEADLEKATEDLNRTVIRAPYDGMVREKRADIGQFVNVGTAAGRDLRHRLRRGAFAAAGRMICGIWTCRSRLAMPPCP